MAQGLQWNQPREKWDAWDPMLLSEGLFSAANIFSSLKLVYIFSVNPHLGPLQVSLSRMVLDILKFFVLDILVIFAFSCGECRGVPPPLSAVGRVPFAKDASVRRAQPVAVVLCGHGEEALHDRSRDRHGARP